ncbi:MAG TPA: ammonium transporter [Tepidisphaeraceae bacterium]|nr:ammonium transporter [Tepidisphaeraceae bacterium]
MFCRIALQRTLSILALLALPPLALAQDAAPAVTAAADGAATEGAAAETAAEPSEAALAMFAANNLWLMIAAALVFIMHLGFATLESGLCRSKNTVNILTKNVAIVAIGVLTYYVIGFGLMYPGFNADGGNEWFGFAGMAAAGDAGQSYAYNGGLYTYWTDFLFQAMFAATAATIVSGAVAERVKLIPFLLFSIVFVAICYPLIGSWKWGYGFLHDLGFHDFAGSTLVHSVGGWGALAGVMLLGPRLGKYGRDGKVNPIPGHSMPLATIGMFLLWLGWFGFNGGSVLSADPAAVSFVLVTTCLAAAAGGLGALFTSQLALKSPDLSMCLNGVLAGLVGITAGADVISPTLSIVVGGIAGVLVVFAVLMFDKLRLDDPVGATSVHLVCGIWGTLAVGIFGAEKAFMPQLIGVGVCGAAAFIGALVIFAILKFTAGIRVSAAEELEGLDIGEHGMEAYPGFVTTQVGITDELLAAATPPARAPMGAMATAV